MTLQPIYASPGVQLTNSPYSSGKQIGFGSGRTGLGRFSVAQNVEFIEGFPQKVAGFIGLLSSGMTGVPRAIKTWRDTNGTVRVCIGTDSHLYTCLPDGTGLTDITPRNPVYRQITTSNGSTTFSLNYTTTAGSNVVAFTTPSTNTNYNLAVGATRNNDYIMFNWDSASTAATGLSFQGAYQITSGGGGSSFSLTNTATCLVSTTGTAQVNIVWFRTLLANNPYSVTSGSNLVTITTPTPYTQGFDLNGLPTTCGMYVTISGGNSVAGITLSGEYLIKPIVGNTSQFQVTASTTASSTTTGGSTTVVVTYTPPMNQYYTAPSPSGALVFTGRTLPSASTWTAVCYGSPGFVAVATGTAAGAFSANGTSWSAITLPSSQAWSTVCYGLNQYIALVSGSATIATSPNGTTWTAGTLPTSTGVYITPGSGSITDAHGNVITINSSKVALQNGVPIPADAYGHQAGEYYNGVIYFQTASGTGQWYIWGGHMTYVDFNACSAPPVPVPSTVSWTDIIYGNGRYVAVSSQVNGSASNVSLSSSDGINWSQNTMPASATWQSVAYNGNSRFVAIAGGTTASNVASFSSDGSTWTFQTTLPFTYQWQDVCWGGSTFVAVAQNATGGATNVCATSADGVIWTAQTMPSSQIWTSVTFGDGVFVAVAGGSSNTVVATSPNGISWTQSTSMPSTAAWKLLASGNALVVALAAASTTAASAPATTALVAPQGWTLAAYGGLMAASPIGGTIYFYNPLGTATGNYAYPLGNAPAHCLAMFVTPERIVTALGASQDSVIYDSPQITEFKTFQGGNMTIMWSDQADPTIWTSATNNTAQTGRTMQGGDFFVGGIAVRDGTSLIFTNRCCFAMTYSGDYLVYDTPMLADNAGLVSPYAVTAEGGIAVWMNDCDLYSWAGTVMAVATDDVRSVIFGNLNPSYLYKAVAGFNRVKKQVKFWFPTTPTSTENDGCLIFQTDSLVFSTGTIARTGWTDSILGALPFGVDALGNLYQEESGVDANGQPIVATLTFSPIDISNGDRAVDMFGFIPDFQKQVGNLSLSINTQYYPQDPVTVSGPYLITTDDTSPDIDLRCDGKLIGWTVVSNVLGGNFRMGLCRVDIQAAGARM